MDIKLYDSLEKGDLGIYHIARLWSKNMNRNISSKIAQSEWSRDLIIIDTLKLGIAPTLEFIHENEASLEEFEKWILDKNGGEISYEKVSEINNAIKENLAQDNEDEYIENYEVLSKEDLEFFDKNGYIVVKNVISKDQCEKTIDSISNFVKKDIRKKENWYNLESGFWIKMFDDEVLEENRNNLKVRKAYEQLLKSKNIFFSYDRVSINPPQTNTFSFQGPDLHWDVSLNLPMPFGLQGLLYLTDTKQNGGAFSCVAGFHKKIESWLKQFDDESEARDFDLHSLGAKAIEANAGDFIIWDDRLPHGASPNNADTPRIVQYINMYSSNKVYNSIWK